MKNSKPQGATAPKSKSGDDDIQSLWPGQSLELLKELHILTRDGKLNSDSRRKLKQVLHLYQLIRPALEDVVAKKGKVKILDVGAGKNYLGFILYDLFVRQHPGSEVISIESRGDLVERSRQLAAQFGFTGMKFIEARILDAANQVEHRAVLDGTDVLTALHCCDVGTDDAILLGLDLGVKNFAMVPCCQAELAHKLKALGPQHPLHEMWAHPIHAREFGSHLSNVLRGLVLESQGYKVRVTELVGWEHSMKNEFFFGDRFQKTNAAAERKLGDFLKQLPVDSYLITELKKKPAAEPRL